MIKKYIYKNIHNIILILIIFFLIIILNNSNLIENFDTLNKINNSTNRYVCLYAYYEKNDEYRNNLIFFLENGGIRKDVDYYIIINGKSTVDIPTYSNVNIIHRENKGFDFGAWQSVIKNNIKRPYDYYIFINSSVEGPYSVGSSWLEHFLVLFKKDNNVKLVGTSINILESTWGDMKSIHGTKPPYSHVQSMFFILNNEGFNYLYSIGFFDDEHILNEKNDMSYMIINKEIMMSQLILKKNWNINSILSKYRDIDYRSLTHNINTSGEDPYYKGAYFGNTITPDEVIFYKGYRLK
jgi:hypothetical protein